MLLQIVNLIPLVYFSKIFGGANTTKGTITLKQFPIFGYECFYVCVYVAIIIAIVLAIALAQTITQTKTLLIPTYMVML